MICLEGKLGGQYLNLVVTQTTRIRLKEEDPGNLSICRECLVKVDLIRAIQDRYLILDAHHDTLRGRMAPLEPVDETAFQGKIKVDLDEIDEEKHNEVLEVNFLVETFRDDEGKDSVSEASSNEEREANEERKSKKPPRLKARSKIKAMIREPKKRGPKRKERPPATLKMIRLRTELTRKCYICPADFPDSEDLMAHLTEEHAGKIEYTCQQCDGKQLKTVKSYNVHLSLHDPSIRPLQCRFCSLRYSTRKGLEVHEMRDHGASHKHKLQRKKAREHQCEHCGKIFKSISIVREHTLVEHDQGIAAQCKICQKTFKHKNNLTRHMLTHTGELPHKCDQCGVRFRIVTDLTKHVQGVHQGIMPYFCNICDLPLKDKNSYYRHRTAVHKAMKDTPTTRRYKCGLCGTSFDIQSDLQLHVDRSHEGEDYPFKQCAVCPERFHTASQLQYHKYTKHCEQRSSRATKLQCTICGEQQQTRCHLDSHMTRMHGTEKKYVCSECGSRFTVQANLSRHRKTHNAVKQFACEFCARTFNQKVALDNHRRCAHTDTPTTRRYKCGLCGTSFDIQSDLQLHVDRSHEGEDYPFKQCAVCPERFHTASQLQYHKYTKHCEQRSSRATKLQCTICGEQQQTRCHLDSHMTRMHGTEKKYVCSECGSRFTVQANLSRHRKTHNAVKQFACEFCARTFNQKVALDNHRRCAHTGETAFECETCGKGFKETSTYYRHRVACRKERQVDDGEAVN
ncbi:AAEL012938-PA [Aedes aegypti]|uniref:AAEL012938-PA n=1 Tax=Aedes aegypti TaxID=7159 RepID=Q16KM5_AEDAE|nr:AAEL012938-PA [Aedes aegypti]